MHLFFVLFSFQFHEVLTMLDLKIFQTVYQCMLCEQSL